MDILIVTDAWRPQVNGVVNTLERLAFEAKKQNVKVHFLTPEHFKTVALPGYSEIRLALARPSQVAESIQNINPDALHIATEGTLGILARNYALKKKRRFTSCYHTNYPQYISARLPIPEALSYGVLRHFHNASATTMVATEVLREELSSRGFEHLAIWSRGVDCDVFKPSSKSFLDLPRPIYLSVGRLAIEKNLEEFLSLDLAGSKVVVGDGPDRARLEKLYPDAHFLGAKFGEDLSNIYASSDVFVFPSCTDTFGLVLLEALASGLPVAAFPVPGFLTQIEAARCAVLDRNLKQAAENALKLSGQACRIFAEGFSHAHSTRQFLQNAERALQ